MADILSTSKYSLSEFSLKSGLTGITMKSKNGDLKLFPVEVFELGNFLIDWVREQEVFTDSDVCTVSRVDRALRFEYIDQFTYKIKENDVLVGMATWENSEGKWKANIESSDISLRHRYRRDLFEELQVEYDKFWEEHS